MADLSIIIVNYNVRLYLEQCLDSVRKSAQGLDVEIIVVDNNSSDGSVEYLRQRFPEATFIENQVNSGFAKANNQGIRMATGRYVMLLNPDTVVTETTLPDCLQFMETHADAGALGVKIRLRVAKRHPHAFCGILQDVGTGLLVPQKPYLRTLLHEVSRHQCRGENRHHLRSVYVHSAQRFG